MRISFINVTPALRAGDARRKAGVGTARRAVPTAQTGFTLLELVISLTILALMSVLMFSSLQVATKSYDRSQERLETAARERVLVDQIKRQIGSLFPIRPTGAFLDAEQLSEDVQQMLPTLSRTPLFHGTPETVVFITVAPLMLHEHPGLTVVRYGLANDEWGNLYLGSMEDRYLGLESFMNMVSGVRGKPLALVEDVESVEFQYYGYDAQTQQYDWFDSWSGEEMLAVPEAIRVMYDEEHLTVAVNASFFGTRAAQSFREIMRTR